jgi:hypothetical protein
VIPSLLTAIYAEKLLLDLVCVLWKNYLEFCKRDLTVLLQYIIDFMRLSDAQKQKVLFQFLLKLIAFCDDLFDLFNDGNPLATPNVLHMLTHIPLLKIMSKIKVDFASPPSKVSTSTRRQLMQKYRCVMLLKDYVRVLKERKLQQEHYRNYKSF